MITLHDLDEAIAACQGELNPTANTALKLAAFLTIKREMFGDPSDAPALRAAYSFAAPPDEQQNGKEVETVGEYGDTEFLQAIRGKDPSAMWNIMDELMDTLRMVNKRVYDGVMRQIR